VRSNVLKTKKKKHESIKIPSEQKETAGQMMGERRNSSDIKKPKEKGR
jgi:hypothetical protein